MEVLGRNKKGTKFLRLDVVIDFETNKRRKFAYYQCFDEGHIVGPILLVNVIRPIFITGGCRGCFLVFKKEQKGAYEDGFVKTLNESGVVCYQNQPKSVNLKEQPTYKLPNNDIISLDSKAEWYALDNLVTKRFANEWDKFKFGHLVRETYRFSVENDSKVQAYTPDGVSLDGKILIDFKTQFTGMHQLFLLQSVVDHLMEAKLLLIYGFGSGDSRSFFYVWAEKYKSSPGIKSWKLVDSNDSNVDFEKMLNKFKSNWDVQMKHQTLLYIQREMGNASGLMLNMVLCLFLPKVDITYNCSVQVFTCGEFHLIIAYRARGHKKLNIVYGGKK